VENLQVFGLNFTNKIKKRSIKTQIDFRSFIETVYKKKKKSLKNCIDTTYIVYLTVKAFYLYLGYLGI
jgi:hypothetical protein